ncbi:MAG: TIGR03016 family PEP-CTERM system-associated outer membrane protein [Acetobacteraceae bacterium]|nr:TIGR03016 family PEP-CTERM system-associated outer membrane protein [Acetobacteraceae bacterium]
MHEHRPRATLVRDRVHGALLCVALATLGHAALADDTGANTGGTGGPTAGNATAGNPTAGNTGPTGASPSVLPATGVGAGAPDVRLGNLGAQLAPPGGVPPQPANRDWTITPQIMLSEEYLTGGTGLGGVSGNQYITTVTPSVAVTGDTSRLHAEVFYAPQVQFYVPGGSQNQVAENFNARLLATLLPQTLFLDLRGSGSVASIAAGQAPTGTTAQSTANTSQNYTFSASPYALHRFGDWGTGEIGGSIARITQNALQNTLPTTGPQTPAQVLLAELAAASAQNATSYSGHLGFTTGEAFGRYNGAALAEATNTQGQGVLSSAYRDIVSLDSGYAITRGIIALATIGYERIHYAGTTPILINDAIWNVGFRLVPNPDSSITVRYGHQDGLNSVLVDASYQPTARTHIYARYSTGLSTQTELLQNALATSDLDSLGNPVDHATGAPLLPVSDFFGTQNSLFRTTVGSLTGELSLDRDTVTLGVNSQQQKLVSAADSVGLALGSTRGVYGSLAWSHLLREDLQSALYGQYGVTSGGGVAGSQQLVVVSATLSYALTKTLSGSLQYSYNRTFGGNLVPGGPLGGTIGGGAAGTSTEQNIVLLSLAKSF